MVCVTSFLHSRPHLCGAHRPWIIHVLLSVDTLSHRTTTGHVTALILSSADLLYDIHVFSEHLNSSLMSEYLLHCMYCQTDAALVWFRVHINTEQTGSQVWSGCSEPMVCWSKSSVTCFYPDSLPAAAVLVSNTTVHSSNWHRHYLQTVQRHFVLDIFSQTTPEDSESIENSPGSYRSWSTAL